MHKKKMIAWLLTTTLLMSSVQVFAAENNEISTENKAHWIIADTAEEVTQSITDTVGEECFEEAIIDVSSNKVMMGDTATTIEAFLGTDSDTEGTNTTEQLKEAVIDSGYEIKEEKKDTITITSPYQSKRIVVYSKTLDSDYGAKSVISYPEYEQYILEYETEAETQKAYENIKERYDCYVDRILSMESLVTEDNTDDMTGDEEPEITEALTWGRDAMGIDSDILNGEFDRKVKIAVIDSGLNAEHEIFDNANIAVESYDFVNNTYSLSDTIGHGTSVTGIIEECIPDNVEIMVLKIFNDQGYTTDTLVCTAIQYAIENGADIINMSFGGTTEEMKGMQPYDEVIDKAYAAGVTCVCAAGNSSSGTSDMYPANNEKTLAISSITEELVLSSTSNYGEMIDFAAPGDSIKCVLPGANEGTQSGTSFATPHISAALACILSAYNEIISCEDLYDTAITYAVDLGNEGKDEQYGWGLLDLSSLCDNDTEDNEDEPTEDDEQKDDDSENDNSDENEGKEDDETENPEIDHEHIIIDTVILPTCTTDGYTLHTCESCEYSYKDETVPATGHLHTKEKITTVDSTCTKKGKQIIEERCEMCNILISTTEKELPLAEHEKGSMVKENVVTATCTTPGTFDAVVYCTNCHFEISRTQCISSDAKGHSFGEWETVKNATCTSQGTKKRTCKICDYSESLVTETASHSWEKDYTVDKMPTCTSDGSKSIHCANCKVTKDSKTISAIGHDYVYKSDIKKQTCTENGYEKINCVCKNCSHTYEYMSVTLKANGHTWDAGSVTQVATAKSNGIITYKCVSCGTKNEKEFLYVGNHDSSSTSVVVSSDGTVTNESSTVSTNVPIQNTLNQDNETSSVTNSNSDNAVIVYGMNDEDNNGNNDVASVDNENITTDVIVSSDSTDGTNTVITEENASGVKLLQKDDKEENQEKDAETKTVEEESEESEVVETKGKNNGLTKILVPIGAILIAIGVLIILKNKRKKVKINGIF